MADETLSMVGGARLDRGVFSVYIMKENGARCPMNDGPIKEHIRTYYDFLMGDEMVMNINGREVRRGLSRAKQLEMVSFSILGSPNGGGFSFTLFKKNDGFATLVFKTPFAVAAPLEFDGAAVTEDDEQNDGD